VVVVVVVVVVSSQPSLFVMLGGDELKADGLGIQQC
jgi:hypothetical protein